MLFLDPHESLETESTLYRKIYLEIKRQIYMSCLSTATTLDFRESRLEFKNKLFTWKVYVYILHLKLKLTSFVLKFLEIPAIVELNQNIMLAFKNFYICRKKKKEKTLVLGKNKMWFHWGSYSWRIFCQSSEWFSDDHRWEKFLQKK